MRSFFVVLIFLILSEFSTSAQTVYVLDSITYKPIEGVSCKTKSLNFGSVSNMFGEINLSLFSEKDTINITHIAYQNKQIIKSSIKKKTILLLLKTHSLDNIEIVESKEVNFKSPLTSLKITPTEIISSQKTQTSELLSNLMGISVQNSQNGGGSPNLRGMEANRLLVVVDGIALNNTISRSGRLQNTATINPIFLENTEVLFGASSVAYGNSAMGGAILFNTIKPKKENSLRFIQQYETSSSANFSSLISNYKIKKSIHVSGFAIKDYNNLKMGKNRIHGFENWGKEPTITESNTQQETAYQQADFFHKTLLQLSKKKFLLINNQTSTSSNINRFDKLNDIKDGLPKYKYWYYGPRKRFFQSVRLKHYNQAVFSDEYSLTLAYQNITESRVKQKTEEQFISTRIEKLQIVDIKTDFSKNKSVFKINYGFDSRFQKLNSNATLSNQKSVLYNTTRYPDGGTSVFNNALYCQVSINLTKGLLLSGGSRYNANSLKSLFTDTNTIRLPFSEINVKNYSLSNSFQVVYSINNSLKLNSAISNGFRNPNIDDIGKIFSKNDISVVIPNILLNPEKSLNIEVGLELKANNFITLQAQVFQTEITNAIERREGVLNGLDSIFYDGEMMKIMMNKNIGKATIQGVNLNYQMNIKNQITCSGTINLIDGIAGNNVPLAHIPPNNITSSIKYLLKNQRFELLVNYSSLKKIEDYDLEGVDNIEEATEIGNPSWYTINFKYQKKLDENFSVIFGVDNITDVHYKTFGSGISASGRNFSLTLHTEF